MDNYLEDAYIPALHRIGIKHVGVFKPRGESENSEKLIYVLIPFKSINQFESLEAELSKDSKYQKEGKDYIEAHYEYMKKRKWVDTSKQERIWVDERYEGERRIEEHYEERNVPSGHWQEYEEKTWIPAHYE